MAYLRKLPTSRNWIAAFIDGQGRLRNRSTQIADAGTPAERADAKRRAIKVAETYERAARGELAKETKVKATLLELVELVGGPKVETLTARQFLNNWVDRAEAAGKSEATMARYKQVTREFLAALGDKAEAPVENITPQDCQQFTDAQIAKGLAPKTAANAIKVLRIPFAEAVRLGTLGFNPAGAAKAPTVNTIERGTFTPEEIARILDETPEFQFGREWKTAVLFGYYCGARLGDAVGMTWANIDLAARLVSFIPEKTRSRKRAVKIPMHPELYAHLETLPAGDNPNAPLCPTLKPLQRSGLSKQFNRLCRAAGIEQPQERHVEGAGRAVSLKSFHALRHSLVSHLANAGISPELRARITGHTDAKVHAGYTHLEIETLRSALEHLK